MQVVEIYAVVLLDTRQRGNTIYLQQYGQMHKWDDSTNMEHLNAAIVLTNHPRIAKYLKYPGDHTAAYQ
ncbi:hypothetical protein BBBOND_0212240 [Babesia bigemina]|uniref:Uncharacterized protein n=1 Tax=Babesia bigemina TaxID=5866 RepID=A0A061D7V9_BABBI|nr:hypothetical protein BBBOND_0212240 [Babesia bigemina]CDR96082.1 hypothetical protein BBBOND_0212240 [Babesia bigemina]|eukprot:XP_012768268.1 hypothetical protein BBBOND_0212240 [Babesia bigemina]